MKHEVNTAVFLELDKNVRSKTEEIYSHIDVRGMSCDAKQHFDFSLSPLFVLFPVVISSSLLLLFLSFQTLF